MTQSKETKASGSRLKFRSATIDMVTLGTPPIGLDAGIGKIYRVSPKPKKSQDIQKVGITKIHSAVARDGTTGLLQNPKVSALVENHVKSANKAMQVKLDAMQEKFDAQLDAVKKEMMDAIKKDMEMLKFNAMEEQLKVMVKTDAMEEQLKVMVKTDAIEERLKVMVKSDALEERLDAVKNEVLSHLPKVQQKIFLDDLYNCVTLRKVVDDWTASKKGKEFKVRLTLAVNRAYCDAKPERSCDGGNVLVECKTLLHRLAKAEEEKDERAKENAEKLLVIVKKCIEAEMVVVDEFGNPLPSMLCANGLLKVLKEYLRSNLMVHKKLKVEDLDAISKSVEIGEFGLEEGDRWLSKFVHDLLVA